MCQIPPGGIKKGTGIYLCFKRTVFNAKEQIKLNSLTDIQKAARFYILIKESFGSDLDSFSLSNKNMEKAVENIKMVSKRLNMVVIENRDFERLIKSYDRKNALFYLDPPYYKAEKYYSEKFMPQDHVRLKETLDKIKGKFLLSYNDCNYVRELYSDYNIVEVDRTHNLINNVNKPRYKELLIKNY